MGQTAEELRQQLAEQRDDLGRDLEAVGDRVSPGRIVERRQAAMRQRATMIRERVMGTPSMAAEAVRGQTTSTMSTVSSSMSDIGDAARQRTEGNPFAVGIVAFGAGLLASTLLPASKSERRLADRAQPMLEHAAEEAVPAARGMAEELKPTAEQAMTDVKERAQEAVETVKSEAKGAASEMKPSS
jgi:gas vesicle protein